MFFKKNFLLYRLFSFLSKKRKIQLCFLLILLVLNGIFESFSIAAIIPFISIVALKNDINTLPVLGNILNFFEISSISQSLFLITFLFSLLIIFSTFLKMFNIKYTYDLSANLEIELSKLIFKDNIRQSYIDYTNKNSSDLISITLDKVSLTASAICSFLFLIGSSILGIFIISSLLIINWKIVFFGILFLITYYLIIYKKVNYVLSTNGKSLASISPKRYRLLQEVFLGFRDVVVNGTEKIYAEIFNEMDSEYKLRLASTRFISLFPRYLIEGIVLLVLVFFGYYFSLLNVEILTFIPLFGSVIYAFQRLLPQIQQIYSTWANYKAKYPSIIDVVIELENNKRQRQIFSLNNSLTFKKDITFRNICFAYEKSSVVLKDVNFRIKKGEHIGIYGETGSGKSTLLDILIGLLPPSNGEFLIDDLDIHKENAYSSWTSNIAHVSQNIFLKEGTIAENIAYGESIREIDTDLLKKASKYAHIYNFIKKTNEGFNTNVGERGIKLSGGQRQRIAIARAIYKSKDVIILDEATSALDHITEEKIINSVKKYCQATIVMVTHRLKSLKICDRVFKVEENKLFEDKNVKY